LQYVPKRKETHTWPFMKNMWTLRKRLDHVLWRDDLLSVTNREGTTKSMLRLKCLGCGVLTGYETGASDHQPVLSRFGIVIDSKHS
jgi:endonuclease/exonuclease/phosphatase (EEP) superfamily protein YafD